MIVEMNPQDEDGLGNSPDNDRDIDINSDHCPESGPGFDPGFISDSGYVPRGDELRAELSCISSLASELERLNYLSDPKNDHARYRRAQLQSELSSELIKLQRCNAYFDKEVARCDRNRVRIHADSEKIHLDETREYYYQAESLQQKQYREAVSDRDAVSWAISRVQAALSSSRGGGFGISPNLPSSPLSGYRNDSGRLGNEVDDLLDFGPLGRHRQR